MKKKSILIVVASVAAGVSLWAPAASARDQVNWSVTVGSPLYMAPPPPVVYSPPPRVVYQQPVYVAPAPVVQYYGYGGPDWRERREWRHHHRHHHHRD